MQNVGQILINRTNYTGVQTTCISDGEIWINLFHNIVEVWNYYCLCDIDSGFKKGKIFSEDKLVYIELN